MAQDHSLDPTIPSTSYMEAYGIEPDEFEILETDPFTRLRTLGGKNSGARKVCEVKHNDSGKVYARKEFEFWVRDNHELAKKVQKEASIIKDIRHQHIVQHWGIHRIEKEKMFGLLIRPVADKSLAEFFKQVEGEKDTDKRLEYYKAMCQWPMCLFQALDYLHEAKIRHKDIKPSNILIKDNRVYLADFGISKSFRDAATSKTQSQDRTRTDRYMAPETDNDELRGRATDVWALGCTVLEICTVASGNTIEQLNSHLNKGSRKTYFYKSPYHVLDWIFLLLSSPGVDTQVGQHIQKILQLAFIMLDPDDKKRVTMKQLLSLLNRLDSEYFRSIVCLACDKCQDASKKQNYDAQFDYTFKKTSRGVYIPSKNGITSQTEAPWEVFKQRWLEIRIN
ncbi:kinase-like protein [Daldinia loculata]|uniref:kinase-like protein n=1 Tax=Daldinia loculata TaxID=103429 RepID=UPI0020C3EF6A|nr:kinase-like protein [Daldinia loculata]KAI1645004.1 kinase-like protein [Daldinia loculata]